MPSENAWLARTHLLSSWNSVLCDLALPINVQMGSLFSFWTLSMCKRKKKPEAWQSRGLMGWHMPRQERNDAEKSKQSLFVLKLRAGSLFSDAWWRGFSGFRGEEGSRTVWPHTKAWGPVSLCKIWAEGRFAISVTGEQLHKALYQNPAAGPASSSTFVPFPTALGSPLCCQTPHLLWPSSENSLHIKSCQGKNPFAMSLTMRGTGRETLVKTFHQDCREFFCGSHKFWIVKSRVRKEPRKREVQAPCFGLAISTDEHTGYWNNASVNIGVHTSFWISALVFFVKIPRSGIPRYYGSTIFTFEEPPYCFP